MPRLELITRVFGHDGIDKGRNSVVMKDPNLYKEI